MHDDDNKCTVCGTVTPYGECPVCKKAEAPAEAPEIVKPVVPAPVVPEPLPAVETLTVLYKRAVAEVARLKEAIDNCIHDWDESEPKIGKCTLDLGEPRGTETVWVLRQTRDCLLCGDHQARMKFAPDDNWSPWKPVLPDKPETPLEDEK